MPHYVSGLLPKKGPLFERQSLTRSIAEDEKGSNIDPMASRDWGSCVETVGSQLAIDNRKRSESVILREIVDDEARVRVFSAIEGQRILTQAAWSWNSGAPKPGGCLCNLLSIGSIDTSRTGDKVLLSPIDQAIG